MKYKKPILIFTLLFGLTIVSVALAQNDSLIGGQNPNETMDQILQPFKTFISWVSGLIENIILHLFDWEWIRGIFTGFFGTIDGWVESITGNNLGGIFRIIGHTLSEVFYFVVNFLKSLWPF